MQLTYLIVYDKIPQQWFNVVICSSYYYWQFVIVKEIVNLVPQLRILTKQNIAFQS